MIYRLLIFLVLPACCFAKYTHELSICAIFQDEAPYLKEWIEFHKLAGVEHFYLYNNRSQDNPHKVLEPYIKKGLVTLIEWPHKGQDYAQHNAYCNCLVKASGKSKWVAFLDLDEFLFPVTCRNLKAFLADYEAPHIAGLCVNWQMYGSSHVDTLPPKKLLIEMLTYKAPLDYPGNYHVKSIIRPEYATKSDTPHRFLYKEGYYSVDPDFNRCPGPFNKAIPIDKIRINHYYARTHDYAFSTKLKRLMKLHGWSQEQGEKAINEYFEIANQEKDFAIKKYVYPLKAKMLTHSD